MGMSSLVSCGARLTLTPPRRNARIETVMTFAQSVYLIFTSVYVCKETLEHILLSSGEGHHHHHGDEVSSVFGCVRRKSCVVVVLRCGQDRVPYSPIIYHLRFASDHCYHIQQSLQACQQYVCSAVSCLSSCIGDIDEIRAAAGNHIPSLASLLPARSRYRASTLAYPPLLNNLLTNPYSLAPVLFASCVLFTAISIPP